MPLELCIVAEFPIDRAADLRALQQVDQQGCLARVGELLIDRGASGVTWRCRENVHGLVLSRPGTGLSPEYRTNECESGANRGEVRGVKRAELNAVQCLAHARHALQKKDLIASMNANGTGRSSARAAIASLVRSGVVCEFSVPRQGRKSAVFVALLG